MGVRADDIPDEAKRKRIADAFRHGVVVADILSRFGISKAMLYKVLREELGR